MSSRVRLPREPIQSFCRKWMITKLELFGSALREDFREDSDIDFLVTFATEADWSLFDHLRMEQELRALLSREVDLGSRRAIEKSRNWIRQREILGTAEVFYAA